MNTQATTSRKVGRPALTHSYNQNMVEVWIADNIVTALRIVWNNQTTVEMEVGHTLEVNNIGFNWHHAPKVAAIFDKLAMYEPLTKWEVMTCNDIAGWYWKRIGNVLFKI